MHEYFDTKYHIEEINNNREDKVNDEYNIRCDVLSKINHSCDNLFWINGKLLSDTWSIADIFYWWSIKDNKPLEHYSHLAQEYIKENFNLTEVQVNDLYQSVKKDREQEQNYISAYQYDSIKDHRLWYIKQLITSMEHRKSEINQTLLISKKLYKKLNGIARCNNNEYKISRFEDIYDLLPISPELDPYNQEYTDRDIIEAISYHKLY